MNEFMNGNLTDPTILDGVFVVSKSERTIFMHKRNIYIMYFIALLQGMVFYAPVATLYRQAQGVTIFQITLIESISLVICMAMELPWGILADRIGYKKTILFCNILYFLSKIVFWKAECFWGFLIERIMLSIVCAGLSGVDASILYLSCKEGESQKVFGIYEGLGTIGLLITSVVYALFIGEDYQTAGLLTVISYGLAMILSFFLREVNNTGVRTDSTAEFFLFFKRVMKNKSLFLFLLGIALFQEVHQTITVFLCQPKYVRAGIDHSFMGILYGLVTIAALSGILSDKVSKKAGDSKTMGISFLVAISACILLAITESALLTVVGILLLRIGFSMMSPLQIELQNRQIDTQNRATALSVNSVFMDSVGIGTNIIFGAVAEYSLQGAFLFGGIILIIGWIFFEIWKKMSQSIYLK